MSDQKQPRRQRQRSSRPSDARTGRGDTLGGNRHRHDGHRAKIHDSECDEYRHEAQATQAAVEADAQAIANRRAGTSPNRAPPRCLPATRQMMRFPSGELQRAGGQDDHPDRRRNGASRLRQFHPHGLDADDDRKHDHPEHRPDENVRRANDGREPIRPRDARPPGRFAIAPQGGGE